MKRKSEVEAQVMFLMGSSESIYFSISSLKDLSDKFFKEHGILEYSFDDIHHAILMRGDEGCVYFNSKESVRVTRLGYSLYAHEIEYSFSSC